jgi:hypothetical protein
MGGCFAPLIGVGGGGGSVIGFVVAISLATHALAYEPTATYEQRTIEGWTVRVSGTLLAPEQKELADRTLALLRVRLFEVNAALPAPALEKLRTRTALWVELNDPQFLNMCYHPSPAWLREHELNPDKAGGVEIANAQHFLEAARDQPCVVLHELAHAYFDQVLHGPTAALRGAFDDAKRSGRYDHVLRAGGHHERAYAMTNVDEFFAELSESYFGTNDFYPFVRAELREHDPKAYEAIRQAWNVPAAAPATTTAATTQP